MAPMIQTNSNEMRVKNNTNELIMSDDVVLPEASMLSVDRPLDNYSLESDLDCFITDSVWPFDLM